jgi:hypothetical protein
MIGWERERNKVRGSKGRQSMFVSLHGIGNFIWDVSNTLNVGISRYINWNFGLPPYGSLASSADSTRCLYIFYFAYA